ncbi:MAG: hypothetical protein UU13_C0006G0003 [Candidatus Nomurabacteria bacterium GW2011_GWB1_40_7]|uniref:TRASH domain-containing protein n=1 Tax=Candidatus Nomurabacteria bacterium GW2011_GWB1_40_7 TaxID=1618744 RepID=A0A0G0T6P0_9BACT|nr:MAG: hypothetical protein UU13_C0006G0003 [Candidatus Nomurabacteria bacterium GW2011_GWB1_40_7]
MFNLFKEKCPVCGMELEKGKNYPMESGKKFCSKNCKEEYKKQSNEKHSHHSGGCCH